MPYTEAERILTTLLWVVAPLVIFAVALSVTTGNNVSLNEHRQRGWFRVHYPDGQVSQPFRFVTALNYRSMFGGRIVLRNSKVKKDATA